VTPHSPGGATAEQATPDGAGETEERHLGRGVSFFSVTPSDGPDEAAKPVAMVECLDAGRHRVDLPFAAALLRAGEQAAGAAVVVVTGSAACDPADLGLAARLLSATGEVGAVVPQVLWADGRLAEAGAVVVAAGDLVSCGGGESPKRSEHSYRRQVDGTRFGCVAVRRSLFPMLALDPTEDDPPSVVANVVAQIRNAGHAVVYEPSWTVTVPGAPPTPERAAEATDIGSAGGSPVASSLVTGPRGAAVRDAGKGERILVVCADLSRRVSPWSDGGVVDLIHALADECPQARITVACAEGLFDQATAACLRAEGIEVATGPADWGRWFADRAYHFSHLIVTDGGLFSGLAAQATHSQPQAARVLWTSALPFRAIEAMLPVTPHRERPGHDNVRAAVVNRTTELIRQFDQVWTGSVSDQQHLSGLLGVTVRLLNRPLSPSEPVVRGHGERWGLAVIAAPGADVVAGHEDSAVAAAEEIFSRLYPRDPGLTLTVITDRPTPRVARLANRPGVRLVSPGTDGGADALSRARVVLAPYRHGLGGAAAVGAAMSAGTPFLTTSAGGQGIPLGDLAPQAVFDGPLDLVERAWILHHDASRWKDYRDLMADAIEDHHSQTRFESVVRSGLLGLGVVPAAASGVRRSLMPRLPCPDDHRGAAPWRTKTPALRPADPPGRVPGSVPDGVGDTDGYHLWCQARGPTPEVIDNLAVEVSRLEYRPRISIITPVYNTDPDVLEAAIESVRAQVYENWELCLADDCSTRPETRAVLERAAQDPRVRVVYLPGQSGISGASNAAITLASGEYVTLLDHDDLLKAHALAQVVRWLNVDPGLDVVYSDEDKLDQDGTLVTPFFKPDWSPNLLTATNYVCHLLVVRKSLVDKIGGFRSGFDGSQDHDLVLRLTEQTDRISHIPEPLYTWRMVPGSAAAQADAKPYAFEAAKRALREALSRRGQAGTVDDGAITGVYRARYPIPGQPKVSIIIPTRDKADLLRRCIESIQTTTTWCNYEIVVIDNESREAATLQYLASLRGPVIRYPAVFNYARMMNLAAHTVECDAMLFLNNDTEVINGDWIEALLEHGLRPEVGAVGCRLYLPDGQPQHEGIIVGAMGTATNVDHAGFWGLGEMTRDCSAVTGACTMIRPSVYWAVGGNDERLRVAYNDVDICLRIRQAGYQVVYTPYAKLVHIEGASRSGYEHVDDKVWFSSRWRPSEEPDPYYNPNFDRGRLFRLAL
jgi:GT2 family glycosyltransferase